MGIVNVTPDSFSDGGLYMEADRAVRRGCSLAAAGADIIDVGGESTRPGAHRIPAEEQKRRILPVVRELVSRGLAVSIDTMSADVADAAVQAGATLVNDVSGGLADREMARCVAEAGVPFVAMHWRAPSDTMHRHRRYHDVVADVTAELSRRIDALVAAGVDFDRIVVDPGLGFAKDAGQNWELLAQLHTLHELGRPLLIGASRKSFLGALTVDDASDPGDRDAATAAVSAIAAAAGAFCVRVHSVADNLAAVRVVAALKARDAWK
ncbi:dihydropteroate synthase [Mycolicibacterium sp. 120322]